MELLPAVIRYSLPPLYAQENDRNPFVHLKYFTPDSNWTWFVTEGQPQDDDFIFFGYVCGLEQEWGYFLLSELQSIGDEGRLPIERDLYFTPGRFDSVNVRYRTERRREP